MIKYYTRACNLNYHHKSKLKEKNNKHFFLHGVKKISFNTVEIISRKYKKKKIKISNIKYLNKSLKKKIYSDLRNIRKKKSFKNLNLSKFPLIMGIINLTPDSFSDGGKYNSTTKALRHAKNLINSGCDIIDIGSESTRPGSKPVNEKREWQRMMQPLKAIRKLNKFISIDTRKTYVMKKALKYKVNLINDISGLKFDNETLSFLKQSKLPFVIHHSKGDPSIMQDKPIYSNVLLDIYDFFENKINELRSFGIKHNNILLDPGIGFGKNLKHNITILKNISIFHSLGLPLLLGTSKKRFIKEIAKNNDTINRYGGTISSNLFLMSQGVQVLRIHDVNEINQGIGVYKSLIE